MDIKRHAHIYDELLKLDIELNYQDVPPPSYIQELIIKCNSYQLKVERYFIEVTRDLANAERLYTTEKLNINILRMSILTNDARIKKLPTGKEREAAADEMLENNNRELLKLENDVNDLKSILSAIRQKQNTLKNTNNDVKSLLKLMEQQVNRMNIGHPDDPDVKELSKAFSDIDKLEEEFDLDDVESSTEINESENSEDAYDENSAEPDTQVASVEIAIDLDVSVDVDESVVIGDEPKPDPAKTDETQEHGSQITEDVEDIISVPESQDVESLPDSEEQQSEISTGGGDIEDELASLLGDDDSGFFDPRKEDAEPDSLVTAEDDDIAADEDLDVAVNEDLDVAVEPISEDEPVVVDDAAPTTVDETAAVVDEETSMDMSGIDVDDLDSDSEVESRVSEPPKLEVDLSDLGIDLDIGGVSVPEPTKTPPPTNKKEPTKKASSEKTIIKEEKKAEPPVQAKVVETKKADPPVQKKVVEAKKVDPPVQTKVVETKKPETKKPEVLDIDLNDILDGF